MALPPWHRLGHLGALYVSAVASEAGCAFIETGRMDYGVDGTVREVVARGARFAETGFGFDVQIKATTTLDRRGRELSFDLGVKSYNDIVTRPRSATPLVLVLVCLDRSAEGWVEQGDLRLTFNASAF